MKNKKQEQTEESEQISVPTEITENTIENEPTCGIVMPISPIDDCSAEHWGDVLAIIKDSVCAAGFKPNLVSDADDSGIIQSRIVQNLYKSDIVVCDVSAKNPNVMFELGLRLAFDKPTIIVKDDRTDYSFDTSVIEHLTYPRDLRFNKINHFKLLLKDKIEATHRAAQNPEYTTFLKHFGEFKIAQLEQKEVSSTDYIIQSLKELKEQMFLLKKKTIIDTNPISTKYNDAKKREEFIIEFCDDHDCSLDALMINKDLRFKLVDVWMKENNVELSNMSLLANIRNSFLMVIKSMIEKEDNKFVDLT